MAYPAEPAVVPMSQTSQPVMMDAGMPATYVTSSPYMPYDPYGGAYSMSPYMPAMPAAMPMSGLDHSQGKWFAPGEALPPGFVVCAHPEDHMAPQEGHAMTDMARESFVIPASTAAAAVKTGSKAKKSKKKKSSGCCG